MQQVSRRRSSWPTVLARAGGVLVCLAFLQQCNRAPAGPTGPTGPVGPDGQIPPNVPNIPSPFLSTPQVFVGAGDIAICGATGNSESTARLLDGIGGTVFTLGDNAYPNGSLQDFRECYEPTWGRHKDRTRPAPGNHEYHTPGADAYFQYFGANAGPSGLGYYSYDLGAWHVISLNSNEVAVGSAQEAWLRSDLAANAAKCTLAYWHHPLFSSGQNGEHPHMRPMFRMLYDAKVDVLLTGHDHLYERFAPQDADGRPDPARGIREFVVGSGGVPSYAFITQRPNSERRVNGTGSQGVLKMVLQSDTYQWEFITIGQGIPDSGSGSCH